MLKNKENKNKNQIDYRIFQIKLNKIMKNLKNFINKMI